MEMIDVVMKLNGPVVAVGESDTDERRKENLIELCDLADKILYEINRAATTKDRVESSMKDIGEYADNFLKQVDQAYEQINT